MKIQEFQKRTGLSNKVTHWVHKNLLKKKHSENTHRHFTEADVLIINNLKLEKFQGNIKQINGYTHYYISDNGVVYTNKRGFLEEIKTFINHGYKRIALWKDGQSKKFRISRLVAIHFIDNPNNLPVVNHKDGDKLNNNVSNLEWCTISENTKHAFDKGLAVNAKGSDDSQSIKIDMFKDEKFIKSFGSISEASRKLNKHKSGIARIAKNKGTCRDGTSFRYSK